MPRQLLASSRSIASCVSTRRGKPSARTQRRRGRRAQGTDLRPFTRPAEAELVRHLKGETPFLDQTLRVLSPEGKTVWEISQIRATSEATVKFHLRNIYGKLDVTNRVQAKNEAARQGLC